MSKLLATSKIPSAEIPVDQLGPAGIPHHLLIVAVLQGEERKDAHRLADQSQRRFKVYATLSKAPPLNEHIKGDTSAEDGASYLVAPPHVMHMDLNTSGGNFRISKNKADELSFIEFECMAHNVAEARQAFQRTVLPFLDHLSFMNNCPVFLGSIRFDDTKNLCQTIDYISPYRKGTIDNSIAILHLSMKPVYSMYREAKNSSSYFYRFLCYYKILEGLLGGMRAEVFKAAAGRSIQIKAPKQLVPAHPELSENMRPHVGKSMKDFFDSILTPQFRKAVAHFVTDDGGVLDVSAPEHLERYAETMLISELCVRAAIAGHEVLLAQLSSP